ncbi:MAG: hypothetical protein JOY68_09100 [Candidatus Dormibacteraeota bacterium]|nr:hypothetical protein [Candidatus Dormibacteraeota bacterium]
MSQGSRPGLRDRLRRRDRPQPSADAPLPDPAEVPRNRGPWDRAALTNVDITEVVKGQIRSRTKPWQK